jgi:hypothetical protein
MAMKMKVTNYNEPTKQILAIPDHYVALGFKHAKADANTPGLATLVDGRYVVKAGTIYPANDATAIGVVLNDYDVTDGDAMMAVVIHGFIKVAALPAVVSQEAKNAMKDIKFIGAVSAIPFGVRKHPDSSYTYTIGGVDYVINTTGVIPTISVSDAENVDYDINIAGIAPLFPEEFAEAAGFTGGETNNAVVLVEVPFDGSEIFEPTKVMYNGSAQTAADLKYIDGKWYLMIVKGLKTTAGVISGGFATFTLAYGNGTAKTYRWLYNGLTLEA